MEWYVQVAAVQLIVAAMIFSWKCFCAYLCSISECSEQAARVAENAMKDIRDSNIILLRKMEVWHENSIGAANANFERVAELLAVDVEHRYAQSLTHAEERHRESVNAAQKSTNERIADVNVIGASPKDPPEKVQVKPSKASVSRSNAEIGKVAERHKGR